MYATLVLMKCWQSHFTEQRPNRGLQRVNPLPKAVQLVCDGVRILALTHLILEPVVFPYVVLLTSITVTSSTLVKFVIIP
jgi:hypothetical protein